jgi:hypothetical protein
MWWMYFALNLFIAFLWTPWVPVPDFILGRSTLSPAQFASIILEFHRESPGFPGLCVPPDFVGLYFRLAVMVCASVNRPHDIFCQERTRSPCLTSCPFPSFLRG